MSDDRRDEGLGRWRFTISARIASAFGALLVVGWLLTLYVELFGVPGGWTDGWINHIRNNEFQQLSSEAEGRRAAIERWIQDRRSNIELIAAGQPIHALLESSGRRSSDRPSAARHAADWLAAHRVNYGMIDRLMLLRPGTGELLVADGDELRPETRPVPDALVDRIRQEGSDEVIDVITDDTNRRPQLIILRKVYSPDGGHTLAYLAARIDLEDEIKGNTESQLIAFLGVTAEINLYDEQGRFITKPRFVNAEGAELLPLASFDNSRLAELARQGGEGYVRARDYRGENVLAAYRYVRITPEVGWGLVIKKDERETLSSVWHHVRTFVALTAVGLVIVLLLSVWVARHVTRPLRQVVAAARAISGGDWQARARVADRTEVAELAATFNDMAEHLAQWHEELEEQVRAKTEQIRAEEGKLTSFSETTTDGIVIIDDSGLITFWNPAAERIFGFSRSEALGQDVHWLLAPESLRPLADIAFAKYLEAGTGPILNAVRELPALTKSGRQITVELAVSALQQGKHRLAIGTVRDVTERKRTEAALRLVAEQLSVKVGDEYFRSLAATLAELVRADYVIVAELDPSVPGQATTVGAYASGGPVDNFSYQLADSPCADVLSGHACLHEHDLQARYPKDSLLVEMQAQAYAGVPLTDKEGSPIGLVAALWKQPVTDSQEAETYLRIFAARAGAELERLHAERALARHLESLEMRVAERTAALSQSNRELAEALDVLHLAQTELVESEKLASLGSLVAGIAHELNTPIGNSVMVSTTLSEKIRGFRDEVASGRLKRSALTEFLDDLDQGSRLIASSLHRSADLIQGFKQVAVDQTSSQRREFDLKRTIDEVAAMLHPRFKKSTHRLVVDVPDGVVLDSYPGPLGQVLTNLIQNALIHAFAGREGGSIVVSAELVGSLVRLTVGDDGCGMTEEVLGHAFEPFFTTKLGQGGSGLGLNITYNLVTGVLGGRMAISSAVGTGTTVRIELPLVAPKPQPVAKS